MAAPDKRKPLLSSSGGVFCQYLLAVFLLALIQAPQLSSSLEDLSADFPPAARLASLVNLASEASGLSRLGGSISAWSGSLATEREIGAMSEPSAARKIAETPLLPPALPEPARQSEPPARLSVPLTPPLLSAEDRPLPPGPGETPASDGKEALAPLQTPSANPAPPAGLAARTPTSALSFRTVSSLSVQSDPPKAPANSAKTLRRRPRGASESIRPGAVPPPRGWTAPSTGYSAACSAIYSAARAPEAELVLPPLDPPFVPAAAAMRASPKPVSSLLPAPPPSKGPEEDLRVLLTGDSMMMEGLGPALTRALRERADVKILRDAKYSTGLSRRDYFDWPLHMADLVEQHSPDLVIIALGGNDSQDIVDVTRKRHLLGASSWEKHYLLRAAELVAAARKKGALVIWVGLPVMGNSPYAGYALRISRQQRLACSDPRSQAFVDTLPVLADAKGGYLTYARNKQGAQV
ncbi:MAG: DUF459 domain-containing protein, partial [Deltaproteobacteria bacterium]|nr:DUF459 domain-containing protein [Deltaproteobacteria bacterium]